MPIFGGEKPFTSVTVKVNQLCTPDRNSDLNDDSMEIYLDQLISLIKLQNTGASEAARAIRKKIKYGNSAEEMLLALNLLELMVLNAGPKIGRAIAGDDKLGDLLRAIISGNAYTGNGTAYDPAVIRRFRNLAIGWKSEFRDLEGYKALANLWKVVPRKKTPDLRQSEFRSELVNEERSPSPDVSDRRKPPPRPRTMSPYTVKNGGKEKRSKKKKSKGKYADEAYKIPQINYKVEAPKIRTAIANCHTHTTALENILLTLPEGVSPLDDQKAASEFEKCRKIRHQILRYLQFVGAGESATKSAEVAALDDEFLGALIMANEQLVTTFTKFDLLCGYTAEERPSYDTESSAESYYDSDESLADQLEDVHVHESSSRLAEVVLDEPVLQTRPAAIRQNTAFSVGTTSSDPFGDPFGDKNVAGGF